MNLSPADLELLKFLLWQRRIARACDLAEVIPEQEVTSPDTDEEVQQ